MILYFSASCNSKYLANKLGDRLNDEVVDLFAYMREGRHETFISDKPFVLVSPTYSWRVPRFLSAYLSKCNFRGFRDFYVVMDYGDSCGNAYMFIKEDIEKLGLNFRGLYGIRMPENYVMLIDLEADEVNRRIIGESTREIEQISTYIKNKETFPKKKVGLLGKLQSALINPIFFKFIVKDRDFYATDECISCGLCKKVCVLNNISYQNSKPIWNGKCTHCSACISKCPVAAIEYGKKTQGKKAYLLSKIWDK